MTKDSESNDIVNIDEISKGTHLGGKGIGVCDNLEPADLIQKALDYGLGQVVQSSGFLPDEELNSAKLLASRKNVLVDCPLSTILSPNSVSKEKESEFLKYEAKFVSSKQKFEILEKLEDVLVENGAKNFIQECVMSVADEFFSNAVYNASYVSLDDQGSTRSLKRTEYNEMAEGQYGRLFLGCDDKRWVLGCEDTLGTLCVKSQLERIQRCFEKGVAEVLNITDFGGAGVGSYLILANALSYYVDVIPNKKTMVCATFPLKMRRIKCEMLPKNIHFSYQ